MSQSRALESLESDLPEPEPEPRRTAGGLVALWIGVILLFGGGVFGAVYVTATDEGSPEEAARRLFQAIADEDVLGAVDAFAPSERDAVADSLPDLAKELQRLEILSKDFSLNKVSGVNLTFENVEFTAEAVADELSLVRVKGGKASYRVEPKQLPLGDFVTDLIGEDIPDEASSGSEDMVTEDADPAEDYIAAIKEDGRWYLSVAYTVAEQARREAGAPLPKLGEGLEPDGEESPEKAVEAMIKAGLALDAQRAIALVDPEEGRALHDYASLFIDDAKAAAAEVPFSGTLKSIELRAKRTGDNRATVAIGDFAIDFQADGSTGSVAYDGECVTVTGPDVPPEEGRICKDDAEAGLPPALADIGTTVPDAGIVVVERDGEWYVAPVRSLMEGLVATLKAFDREDLDSFVDFFGGLGAEFESEFEEMGEQIEVAPEGGPDGLPPDIDDDGLIGGYTPEQFTRLNPEEQQKAYEEEFAE